MFKYFFQPTLALIVNHFRPLSLLQTHSPLIWMPLSNNQKIVGILPGGTLLQNLILGTL